MHIVKNIVAIVSLFSLAVGTQAATVNIDLSGAMVIVAASESETRKTNPQAADFILRARALSSKGNDPANLEQRIELYKQALKLEPNNLNAMSATATIGTACTKVARTRIEEISI